MKMDLRAELTATGLTNAQLMKAKIRRQHQGIATHRTQSPQSKTYGSWANTSSIIRQRQKATTEEQDCATCAGQQPAGTVFINPFTADPAKALHFVVLV